MFKENSKKLIIRGIIVILIFYFGFYFKLIPIKLFHLNKATMSKPDLILLSVFSNVCIMITYIIIYRKDLKKEFKIFIKKPLDNLDIGLKYWMYGLIIMVLSNLFFNYVLHSGGANNENNIRELIKYSPWAMFIMASFIAPFNEELVFRKTLKDVIEDKWYYVVLSFLFFGAAHVVDSAQTFIDYLYIIPYGALGGAFALIYYETDTIFTSMFIHMLHNIILTLAVIAVL